MLIPGIVVIPQLEISHPGRLDFIFFTNSVMTCDKSFVISTEHMSPNLLEVNNLLWSDTKNASDHFPVVADFIIEFSDEFIQNNLENNEIECFNYNIKFKSRLEFDWFWM